MKGAGQGGRLDTLGPVPWHSLAEVETQGTAKRTASKAATAVAVETCRCLERV
jgi:hypothetical protein